MIDLLVCVGGSCHLGGAFPVIKELEGLIVEHGLANRVSLRYSSCMDDCTNGVCLSIDGRRLRGVGTGNVREIFLEQILAPAFANGLIGGGTR